MDFNQLSCFVAVARTLNFSEAARRIYVSQSTVSRYISELEKELDAKLFIRSRRDVVITPEGKALLPYATELLTTQQRAKTVVGQMNAGGEGKLTVGHDITSIAFTVECVAAFRKKYPNVSTEIRTADTDDLAHSLIGGEFDLCFLPRDIVPESFELDTIFTYTDPLSIVYSTEREIPPPRGITALADEKLLLLSEKASPILYMEIKDLLRTFHISPKAEITIDNFSSLYAAVASGTGISVLPRSMADYCSEKRISQSVIEDAETEISYVMAWSKASSNTAFSAFRQTVRELAKAEDNILGI